VVKKLKKIAFAVIAILIAYGVYYVIWGNDKAKIEAWLAEAQIDPLPVSATNIFYHQWNGLFTGETYAKFQLSPDDLQKFIQRVSAQPHHNLSYYDKLETFDSNHQLRPISEYNDKNFDSLNHSYFGSRLFPPWFDMTIRKKGKRFVLDWGPNMWVVLNEETNTVFLWIVKG